MLIDKQVAIAHLKREPGVVAGGHAISLRDVSLRIGATCVLSCVRFDLEPGSFLSILGPNGSGKTTLIKVMLGLLKPDLGQAIVLGWNTASSLRGGCTAMDIGYVPQAKTFERGAPACSFDLVVSGLRREWAWTPSRRETEAALAALHLAGAGHLAERQLGTLSGGEIQRVYLARAMARKPALLLLDEPASGIDALGETDMYHILEEFQRERGCTIVMVTHDWAAAMHHAGKAMLLNRSVIAYGDPTDVLSDENLRIAFGHGRHDHGMGWGGLSA